MNRAGLLVLSLAWVSASLSASPLAHADARSAARLLRAASAGDAAGVASALRAGADADAVLPVSRGPATALHAAIAGWHESLDPARAPRAGPAAFEAAVAALLAGGADPAVLCAPMDAVAVRAVDLAAALLARLNDTALGACVHDPSPEAARFPTLLHLAAVSSSSGLARVAIRADAATRGAGGGGGADEGVEGVVAGDSDSRVAGGSVERVAGGSDERVAGGSDERVAGGSDARRAASPRRGGAAAAAAAAAARGSEAAARLAAARRGLEGRLRVSLPRLSSPSRELTRAALEAGASSALVDVVVDAALRLPPAARAAALAARDALGRTAADVACEEGRPADLLALRRLGPRREGRTPCAHAAAVRGHVGILAALAEEVDEDAVAFLVAAGACGGGGTRDGAGLPPAPPRRLRLRSFSARAHVLAGWRLASPRALAAMGLPRDLFLSGVAGVGSSSSGHSRAATAAGSNASAGDGVTADDSRHGESGEGVIDVDAAAGAGGLALELLARDDAGSPASPACAAALGRTPQPALFVRAVRPGSVLAAAAERVPASPARARGLDRARLRAALRPLQSSAGPRPLDARVRNDSAVNESVEGAGVDDGGDDGSANAGEDDDDGGDDDIATLPDLLAWLGGARVTPAVVPYAATYSRAPLAAARVADFVDAHMGNALTDADVDALSGGPRDEALADADVDALLAAGVERQSPTAAAAPEPFGGSEGASSDPAAATASASAAGLGSALPPRAWSGPGARASPPAYVFDGTLLRSRPALLAGLRARLPPALAAALPDEPELVQLIIGPPLSGAPPHFHGAAVNVLLAGVKLWFFWPPADAFFHAGGAAAEWLGRARRAGALARATAALQEAGDAVYVPAGWGHAVLNLADSLAVALE